MSDNESLPADPQELSNDQADKSEGDEEQEDFFSDVPDDVEDIDLTHYRLRQVPDFSRFKKIKVLVHNKHRL